ncbi:MAG: homoserine kinase [Aquificaceae bacterium]
MFLIKVPASTSNLGPCFDSLGIALNLKNTIKVLPSESLSVKIQGYGEDLPKDTQNLVIKSYLLACESLGIEPRPMTWYLQNNIPISRGLGSSASAIVAGIVVAFHQLREPLDIKKALQIALKLEPHPDNVLPSLLGGMVVCAGDSVYHRLDPPQELYFIACIPEFEIKTEKARKVLPTSIPLKDAVFNIQRSSLLISSLLTRNFDLLKEATKDMLHQPYRAPLVPGFYKILERAFGAGSLGVFLSGSGPTIMALSLSKPEEIAKAMIEAFEQENIKARYLILKPSDKGAEVFENPDT